MPTLQLVQSNLKRVTLEEALSIDFFENQSFVQTKPVIAELPALRVIQHWNFVSIVSIFFNLILLTLLFSSSLLKSRSLESTKIKEIQAPVIAPALLIQKSPQEKVDDAISLILSDIPSSITEEEKVTVKNIVGKIPVYLKNPVEFEKDRLTSKVEKQLDSLSSASTKFTPKNARH